MNEELESENNQEVAVLDEQNDISTQDEVVEEEKNENNLVENQTAEQPNEEMVDDQNKNVQSKEDNSAARSARLRAEQDAKKKIDEAYKKGLEDAKTRQFFGKLNPYTGEVIEDNVDAQQFLEMQKIESEGGDPLVDYTKKIKEKERQEIIKQNEVQKEIEKQQKLNEELDDFIKEHPDLDVEKLLKDENFAIFAEGKIGNKSIKSIYDDYNKVVNHYQKNAEKKAKEIIANNNATPGSLNGGKQEIYDFETMSSRDFEIYKRKVLDSRYN